MIVEAQGLSKRYGKGRSTALALQDVSFSIKAGESVALMGPSGSGKSTLLSIIGLILRPSAGELLVTGDSVADSQGERARLRNEFFGYLHQEFAMIESETVERNVGIPLEYAKAKIGRRERRQRTRAVLEQVGLDWALKKRASDLSGGERQRVAIARALVNNPALILADEPTAALDRATAHGIMTLILSVRERGASVLIATHDDLVATRCDRIVRMEDGRLL